MFTALVSEVFRNPIIQICNCESGTGFRIFKFKEIHLRICFQNLVNRSKGDNHLQHTFTVSNLNLYFMSLNISTLRN